MEKYRVTLTTEERVGLERLVSTGRGRPLASSAMHASSCWLMRRRGGAATMKTSWRP